MMASDSLPVVAFTMGDPGGNGPELVLRVLDYFSSSYPFIPLVFGSKSLLDHPFLKPYVKHKAIELTDFSKPFEQNVLYFHDVSMKESIVYKKASAVNGQLAYSYLCNAVESIQKGVADVLVTAPICKESFQMADIPFTGHTTALKQLTGSKHVSMAFHTSTLNVVLATIHVPLSAVSDLITPQLLQEKLDHAVLFLNMLGNDHCRVALAGLNPHAGENGLLGDHEKNVLEPFIKTVSDREDVTVSGPYPADTLFYRAAQGEFDVVIAMYHDQGLIPIKLNHFNEAVNVTLGLPFIRTSPDHGTAFDRAYDSLSSMGSMLSATRLACQLVGEDV
ncbi:4-hydroxythreonine-4-phosphate dehydrogenase PdxA [bacterium]|nr:4-hydroxythreonine-4-phosphate dehydrogenase PdxA [bacterium]